jgi:hypothetical protein
MGDETEKFSYNCAFCSEDTADDPRRVHISLSWDHSVATQRLGAHFGCLQAALRADFHSTTVLSDKPSIAEPTLSAAEARSRTNSGNA